MNFNIIKRSGKKEPFSKAKVRRSLSRSGVPLHEQQTIIKAIYARKPRSTAALHTFIAEILKASHPARAARYNLKQALIKLGPAGFPFEQFIGFLFTKQNYSVALNQTRIGACGEYEIDIVADKGTQHLLIECKFHNRLGLASDIKIPLYVKARFDDIVHAAQHDTSAMSSYELLIATNTRFTSAAQTYATCIGIQLLSWDLPAENNLPMLIDRYNIHPITALSGFTGTQLRTLIAHNIITCSQLLQSSNILQKLALSATIKHNLLNEAEQVCILAQEQASRGRSP